MFTSSSRAVSDLGVIHRWLQYAERKPTEEALVHWVAGGPPTRWTWADLVGSAFAFSAKLKKKGIRKGDVCALIFRHHAYFYPLYMGLCFLGAVPAVLAYPNARLHPEKFREGLKGMIRFSGLDWILMDRSLEPVLDPILSSDRGAIRDFLFPLEECEHSERVSSSIKMDTLLEGVGSQSEPCLLQYSSGTTGLQKGVVLSHKALTQHLENYAKCISLRENDKVVSWLPLYHDMGLIAAFHLPLAHGIPSIQIDAFEWVQWPALLFKAISDEKATLYWMPNFAYNFMADRVKDYELSNVKLDSLRMVVNCSEPVRYSSQKKFLEKFFTLGLRSEALATCYAMAETTFAVTQSTPDSTPTVFLASSSDLSRGFVRESKPNEKAYPVVSSGRLVEGCQIKIVNPDDQTLPDGVIGEVLIQSDSMFDGYRNDSEKTQESLKNGWFHSGDLGFRWKEEYFIVGRKKDMIIVAGKNIYPQDVEETVGGLPGVIPGRVVAFGDESEELGTEEICVVAETDILDSVEQKALRLSILEAGMKMDVTISRVFLVSRRWLIKSSSGKLSRGANKKRALLELMPIL